MSDNTKHGTSGTKRHDFMKPYPLARDLLEERAAIMAEANGWSQSRAERHIAYERGFRSWGELMRAAK